MAAKEFKNMSDEELKHFSDNLCEETITGWEEEFRQQWDEAEKSASKRFTLTADDLVEPSNMWHVKAIQRYNKTGFCNNLLGEIDDYPQAVVKGLIEQTRTMLESILKEDSYQRLVNSGAFQV